MLLQEMKNKVPADPDFPKRYQNKVRGGWE